MKNSFIIKFQQQMDLYRQKMKYISPFLLFIILVGFLYLVQPIKTDYTLLTDTNFEFTKCNIEATNFPATIAYTKEFESFFMHPGQSPSILTFGVSGSRKYIFEFGLQRPPGNTWGNILFEVRCNKKTIKKITVTSDIKQQASINAKNGDTISIIANKNGDLNFDWGLVKISKQNGNKFTYIFIVIIWSLLIYFFWRRKLTYLIALSCISFILSTYAEYINFGEITLPVFFIFMLTSICFSIIFLAIIQTFGENFTRLGAVLCLTLLILHLAFPIIIISGWLRFHQKFTEDVLVAILQSNVPETLEFITASVSYVYIFIFLATLYLLYKLFKHQHKRSFTSIPLFSNYILASLSILFFYVFIPELPISKFIYTTYSKYFFELQEFKTVQELRKSGAVKYTATKQEKGETYIVIIGESLNKDHMGVYGYFRNTTPNLSRLVKSNELLQFTNAFSNHTQTTLVLELALTEANQQNDKTFYQSPSILDILNTAGFETYWISNQVRFGGWDNVVTVISEAANHSVRLNKNVGKTAESEYDEVVIAPLESALNDTTRKNKVVFVHLMGSHGHYNMRYPHNFERFTGLLKANETGLKEDLDKPMVNLYDNSVLYNDSIVNCILGLAKKHNTTAVVYFSDHGEEVFKNLGHTASAFTYGMSRIPLLIWLSPIYKERYKNKVNYLQQHQDVNFCNDFMYDFIIGLTSVKTDHYNAKYDLTDSLYNLQDDQLFTLHKKVKYIKCPTRFYWQDTTEVQYIK